MGDIFTDTAIAAAMLDRLLHKSVLFAIAGDSHRLRAHQEDARRGGFPGHRFLLRV